MINVYKYYVDPSQLSRYSERADFLIPYTFKLAKKLGHTQFQQQCPKGLTLIKSDPYFAYIYASDVIHGRFYDAEAIISQDPEASYSYAKFIIKGKWLDGEDAIETVDNLWGLYNQFLYTKSNQYHRDNAY